MSDPVDFLLRAAMRLRRPQIERLAEGIIAGLDALDGDPDLEEDDHSGDPLEKGDGEEIYETLPRYDVDQSAGPINEKQAYRVYMTKLLGLDRE